jgi:hypothetical protein
LTLFALSVVRTATWRLLCVFLLVNAICRAATAQDVETTSGAATTRLHVEIVFDRSPMSPLPGIEALAIQEATIIWAAYGVDINMSKASDCRRDNAVRLRVRFDSPDRRTASRALGSIRFLGGVPEPTIVMYPDVILALVSTTSYLNLSLDSASPFRDLILGRVLGRALAHEIGHFLLRSREHSAEGLMRALQPTAELIDPRRHRFGLSADEAARLKSVFDSAPAAGD